MKEVPRDCRDILENLEKREIPDRMDQEEETVQRESGEIQALLDHRDPEEVGVHAASEALLVRPGRLEQRGNLGSQVYLGTEEIRDLLAPRGTEDNRELVDQWAYQANPVCQDFPALVERRDRKEKLGHRDLQECQVVEVL